MEIYANYRVSGVTHFEIGEDYIKLKFKNNSRIYTYYISSQVEIMKALSFAGKGLNSYLNRVNPRFR
jgi:hypothetical protein